MKEARNDQKFNDEWRDKVSVVKENENSEYKW